MQQVTASEIDLVIAEIDKELDELEKGTSQKSSLILNEHIDTPEVIDAWDEIAHMIDNQQTVPGTQLEFRWGRVRVYCGRK